MKNNNMLMPLYKIVVLSLFLVTAVFGCGLLFQHPKQEILAAGDGEAILNTDWQSSFSDKTITKIIFSNTPASSGGVSVGTNGLVAVYDGTSQTLTFQAPSGYTIYAPANSTGLFKNLSSLTSIDLTNFNTEKVRNFTSLFEGCSALQTLDMSRFDVNNVTNITNLLKDCSALRFLDLSNWLPNSTKVTFATRDNAFSGLTSLFSLNASNSFFAQRLLFNMMSDLYDRTNDDFVKRLSELKLNNCTFTSSTDVSDFCDRLKSSKKLTTFECSDMQFDTSKSISLSNISTFFDMIKSNTNLTSIKMANVNVTGATSVSGLFGSLSKLTSLDISGWDLSNCSTASYVFASGSLVNFYAKNVTLSTKIATNFLTSQYGGLRCNSHLKLVDMSGFKITGDSMVSLASMLSNCSRLETVDFSNADFSKVNSLSQFFNGNTNLKTLTTTGWNISNVQDMSKMFVSCRSLTNLDVSDWNVSSCTNMSCMFQTCSSLKKLDLSTWNVSKVTDISNIFQLSSALEELNLSKWNLASCSKYSNYISTSNRISTLILKNFNVDSANAQTVVKNFFPMLGTYLKNVDLSNCNVGKLQLDTISGYFTQLEKFILNPATLEKPLKVGGEYNLYTSNGRIFSVIDSSTGNTNMTFVQATGVLPVGWRTSLLHPTSVENINILVGQALDDISQYTKIGNEVYMNADADYKNITIYTTSPKLYLPGSSRSIFSGSTTHLKTIDLSNVNTTYCYNMNNMFSGDSALQTIDLSKFDTSNVTDMSSMFKNCSNLTQIKVSKRFNTLKVENFSNMLEKTLALTTDSLQSFVNNMQLSVDDNVNIRLDGMFQNCSNITEISLAYWDTSRVTSLSNLFSGCTNLSKINLINFDWSNVTTTSLTFENSLEELKIDTITLPSSLSFVFSNAMFCNGKIVTTENGTNYTFTNNSLPEQDIKNGSIVLASTAENSYLTEETGIKFSSYVLEALIPCFVYAMAFIIIKKLKKHNI